ncbi:MAG: MarR family transcriptional regulator [Candidatus Margulisbacteria bacterium]|nr:MarR family transcriptional regulator [Candidatus Margulisiibacteriota bacterium]
MAEKSLKEFLDRLEALAPTVVKSFQLRDLPDDCDITMPQCLVMRIAHERENCKMSDISAALGVTLANVTSMVDRLHRDGFVERSEDPDDRRIVRIALTKDGRKIYGEIREAKRRHLTDIFGRISNKDREQLLSIMGKIAAAMKEEGAK